MANVTLSEQQQRDLSTNGWVVLPHVVPERVVDKALRNINLSLGRRDGLDARLMSAYRSVSFAPDRRRDEAILAMAGETPILEYLRSLFGAKELHPLDVANIRLTFPGDRADLSVNLDRHQRPDEAWPTGLIDNYAALVGIQLTTIDADASGYVVRSGSHLRIADYLQRRGLHDGNFSLDDLKLPEPEHVPLERGDAILFHYLTSRALAGNASPDISYVAEFQVDTYFHDTVWWKDGYHWEDLTDLWYEWRGLAALSATK